jgi:hypothetical protein
MNWFQRLILSILPRSWAEAAEAESRRWMLRCAHCGHEQSIWDAGGIRWKGGGKPRTYRRCVNCRKLSWQRVSLRDAA